MKERLILPGVANASLPFAREPAADSNNRNEKPLLACAIKGGKVKNLQEQNIGDIDQILIDPGSGCIQLAVLSVGGFLGIGDTHVAVPWGAFRAFQIKKTGEPPQYVLDASKERLEKAPRVEGKSYDRIYLRAEAESSFAYWG